MVPFAGFIDRLFGKRRTTSPSSELDRALRLFRIVNFYINEAHAKLTSAHESLEWTLDVPKKWHQALAAAAIGSAGLYSSPDFIRAIQVVLTREEPDLADRVAEFLNFMIDSKERQPGWTLEERIGLWVLWRTKGAKTEAHEMTAFPDIGAFCLELGRTWEFAPVPV